MTPKKHRPFIIWTLQRTGGTNLSSKLMAVGEFPAAQHEPFNKERDFGYITAHWQANKNHAFLNEEIRKICEKNTLIKHCVETVPLAVTDTLLTESIKAGYNHLFLYRKNSADRLLSLHFAQKTGLWGANMAKFQRQTGAKEANTNLDSKTVDTTFNHEKLPINQLLTHERECIKQLGQVWSKCIELGGQPYKIAYETLYSAQNSTSAVQKLQKLLDFLGLAPSKDVAWCEDVLNNGEQGTRDKYALFPGVNELKQKAKLLPSYPLGTLPVNVIPSPQNFSHVLESFIDVVPAYIDSGETITLGGVVVLDNQTPDNISLTLRSKEGEKVPVKWGLSSPVMNKKYPKAKNTNQARWRKHIQCPARTHFSLDLNIEGKSYFLAEIKIGV